jgi:hypothetical protein
MKLPVSEYCSLPYRAGLNNNSISLCFRSVSLNIQRSELQEVYGIFQAVNPKLVLKINIARRKPELLMASAAAAT